jgi:hypothetical protein
MLAVIAFMKILLTIVLIMTANRTFGQDGQLIIGRSYSAGQNSTVDKVYISIQNDLDYVMKDINLTYDKQPILTIRTLKGGSKKCYSFLKKELRGENVFILQIGAMSDTLRGTDEISYNLHVLEFSNQAKPLTDKDKRNLRADDKKNEDAYFVPEQCNYRQQKL